MDKKDRIRLIVLSVIITSAGIVTMIFFMKSGNEIYALFSDLMFTIAGTTMASFIEIKKKYNLIWFSIVAVVILAVIAFLLLILFECEYWGCGIMEKLLMMLFSFVFSVVASYYVSYSRLSKIEDDINE